MARVKPMSPWHQSGHRAREQENQEGLSRQISCQSDHDYVYSNNFEKIAIFRLKHTAITDEGS